MFLQDLNAASGAAHHNKRLQKGMDLYGQL